MGLEGVCASSSSLGEKEHSKQHTASSALHGFLMLPPFVCRFSDRARVALAPYGECILRAVGFHPQHRTAACGRPDGAERKPRNALQSGVVGKKKENCVHCVLGC